jgi:hypothetical protein
MSLVRVGRATTTITFSDYNGIPLTWEVKSGFSGPGNNWWWDGSETVWVDGQGYLHLKIKYMSGKWYCSEVSLAQSLGWGKYTFWLNSRVDLYDKFVVGGLFVYQYDPSIPNSNARELDIEFSKWNGETPTTNGQYAVQCNVVPTPYVNRFNIVLTGDYTSHFIDWTQTSVTFTSLHGHYDSAPGGGYITTPWSDSHTTYFPQPQNERVHINLWLYGATPTDTAKEYELIIQKFQFVSYDTTPPSNPTSLSSPSHSTRVWSSDHTVEAQWSGATDDSSGVYGYSRVWDTNPSTLPDTTVDQTTTYCISAPLSSGNSWYFHLRTVDWAGNWNPNAVHMGPFYIDTNPPTTPTLSSPSSGTTTSNNKPTFQWNAASDSESGLASYTLQIDTSTAFNSGNLKTIPAITQTSYAPSTALSDGTWYWRVKAVDNVGNQGSFSTYWSIIIQTSVSSLSVSPVSPPSPGNGGTVTSSSVTLKALVTSGGVAVQGATVTIYVDSSSVGSGSSDSNGYYSCSYSLTQSGHTYSWYAAVSKSGYDPGTSSTWTFTYSPSSSQIRFTATYKAGDYVSRNIYYVVDGGSQQLLATCDTSYDGTFSVTYSSSIRVFVNVNEGTVYYEELYVDGTKVKYGYVGNNGLTYPSSAPYQVTFNVNPSSGCVIRFSWGDYSNGQTELMDLLSVSVTAYSSSQQFSSWATSGGVSVNPTTTNPTSLTVSAIGTLTANFRPILHWIRTDSRLPPWGNIMYNGLPDGGVFVDLNHDGYMDYVFMNSGPGRSDRRVYINDKGNGWIRDDTWLPPFGNIVWNGKDDGGRFVDLNGDGYPDWVFMNSGPGWSNRHVYINTGSSSSPHWTQTDSWVPPFGNIIWNGNYDGAVFVDLNHDGYTDYVFMNSGPTWSNRRVYINPHSGWSQDDAWLPPFGNIVWNGKDDGARFADLNGDGYPDYIFMNSGPTWSNRRVHLNSGTGSAPHWNDNPAWVPEFGNIVWNGQPDGGIFIDLNGDGYADYVFMNSGPTWSNRRVYLKNPSSSPPYWTQDNSWLPEFGNIVWNGKDDGARFADLNGDGYPDYVFMNSGPTWGNRRVYVDQP